ncbi:MAG: hypothetical protein NVSMB42_05010 [Herpetosiphon sp.]
MKQRLWIIFIIAWTLYSDVAAHRAHIDESIAVDFVGDLALEQLSSGAEGRGLLIYYRPPADRTRPSLLVRLSKQTDEGVATAEVFDAPAGASSVPIVTVDGKLAPDPTLKPVIVIKALDGWWVRAGRPAYNLNVEVIGPIHSMWGNENYLQFIRPGEPETLIRTRAGAGGLPDWDLRRLQPPLEEKSVLRTNYSERKCTTPLDIDRGISPLWPYVAFSGGYEQPVGKLRPPIVVDWDQAKVRYFSELVTVRNQNCSYALYSVNSVGGDRLNHPNFETPFAFYDLSGEGQGYPNLVVRTERYPAGDLSSAGMDPPVQKGRPAGRDFETIRYSWRDAVGDGTWDYKIEVLGFHPYLSETPIMTDWARIDAPSYEQFPDWVIHQNWPAATFIDAAGHGFSSTEGIYDWSPRELGTAFVLGWEDRAPQQPFSEIREGLRGEYRFRKDVPPWLYVSSIDHRLHLLGAEGGLQNLGGGRILRQHNLAGGNYIDGWTREHTASDSGQALQPDQPVGELVEESLYALSGYLLSAGPYGVELRQATYRPASVELLPPTDRASWQSLRADIEPLVAEQPDLYDLRSWAHQFPGISTTITGSHITAVRSTPNGFRFILHLDPGFQFTGPPLLDHDQLSAGTYVVTYDGHWSAEPLTEPKLAGSVSGHDLTQYEPSTVAVALENIANQDLLDAVVELWAVPPQGQATVVTTQTVELLAHVPVTVTLQWIPPSHGPWSLTAKVRRGGSGTIAFPSLEVSVLPARVAMPGAVVNVSAPPSNRPLAVGLMLCAAIAAAFIWSRQWRRSLRTSHDTS